MKVLIVGAGIGGLALASFLKERHIESVIIERAANWHNLGYSLAIWHNGRDMIEKLGLEKAFDKKSFVIPSYNIANSKGQTLTLYHFEDFKKKYHPAMIQIERADLHNLLLKKASDIPLHMQTTLTSLKETETGINVVFNTGKTDTFDILVGADGIHSSIRDMLFGKHHVHYINWRAWYFWIDLKKVPFPEGIFEMAENGEFFGMFPSSKEKACGILAMPFQHGHPDPVETRIERLRTHFTDLGATVQTVLSSIEDPAAMIHSDIAFVDMKEWYKGRIALIGDAVHAMEPFAGMGASMAMEDAYVLAGELAKADVLHIQPTFASYQKKRRIRVEKARYQTRQIWELTKIRSPFLCQLRDLLLRVLPTSHFTKGFEEILKSSL